MFSNWLVEATNQKKLDIVILLIKTFDHLPLKIDALKASNIGKVMKKLESHSMADIKNKASALVQKWRELVKRANKILASKTGDTSNSLKRSLENVELNVSSESLQKKPKTAAQPKKTLRPPTKRHSFFPYFCVLKVISCQIKKQCQ